MQLDIFSWDDDNTEGFNTQTVSEFNSSNEIDLSDAQARELIGDLMSRLEHGHHITIRLSEVIK